MSKEVAKSILDLAIFFILLGDGSIASLGDAKDQAVRILHDVGILLIHAPIEVHIMENVSIFIAPKFKGHDLFCGVAKRTGLA